MAELSVLSPVAETKVEKAQLANRLTGLSGKVVGLVWNGKTGGDILLQKTAELLRQRYSGLRFRDYMTNILALSQKQIELIAKECNAVIRATAD